MTRRRRPDLRADELKLLPEEGHQVSPFLFTRARVQECVDQRVLSDAEAWPGCSASHRSFAQLLTKKPRPWTSGATSSVLAGHRG